MESEMMRDFGNIARMLYEKNWSEGFGGNISLCIRNEGEVHMKECCDDLNPVSVDINMDLNPLNNSVIAITVSGSRMYEIPDNPEHYISLLYIENGSLFNMTGKKPSSELMAHLCAYIAIPSINALIHTHPPYSIAVSELSDTESKFNRTLKESHTEFELIFSRGVALMDRKKPGSMELAEGTSRLLAERPLVIWRSHGVIAGADNLYSAFDLIDIVEKCSHIALLKII